MNTSAATPLAISLYEHASAPALPDVAWPIPSEQWERFVGTDELITFTAVIPLDLMVNGDIDALNRYVDEAFGGDAEVGDTEFRAVGARENENFDERFTGDLVIQVTGRLLRV